MSACSGLGLDNLQSTSMPTRCRSSTARPRVMCSCCRTPASRCRTAPKRFWRVAHPVEVREGEGEALMWARLEPHHGFVLNFEIDFNHPAVDATGQQVDLRHGQRPLQARHRARAHLRLQQGRGGDALARAHARRRDGQRDRGRRLARAQCRRPALRRRIRQAQGARCDRRPLHRRPAAGALHGVPQRPRAQQQAAAQAVFRTRCRRGGDASTTLPRRPLDLPSWRPRGEAAAP